MTKEEREKLAQARELLCEVRESCFRRRDDSEPDDLAATDAALDAYGTGLAINVLDQISDV